MSHIRSQETEMLDVAVTT